MSLINRDFFIGEINVPNSGQESIGEVLDMFIEKYEHDYLTNVLGLDLFKDFIAGLDVVSPATPDAKWLNLLYGAEYTDGNRTYRYRGLIEKPAYKAPKFTDGDLEMLAISDQDPVNYRSPIAYYIYYMFAKNNASMSTTMGEAVPTVENARITSPAVKMSYAWNEMSERTAELIEFLTNQVDVYPNWEKQDAVRLAEVTARINTFGI
jgi:hypothetical protein